MIADDDSTDDEISPGVHKHDMDVPMYEDIAEDNQSDERKYSDKRDGEDLDKLVELISHGACAGEEDDTIDEREFIQDLNENIVEYEKIQKKYTEQLGTGMFLFNENAAIGELSDKFFKLIKAVYDSFCKGKDGEFVAGEKKTIAETEYETEQTYFRTPEPGNSARPTMFEGEMESVVENSLKTPLEEDDIQFSTQDWKVVDEVAEVLSTKGRNLVSDMSAVKVGYKSAMRRSANPCNVQSEMPSFELNITQTLSDDLIKSAKKVTFEEEPEDMVNKNNAIVVHNAAMINLADRPRREVKIGKQLKSPFIERVADIQNKLKREEIEL